MTVLLNILSNWLLFLKKQVFIPAIPNTRSKGVCLFVCARVHE